MKTTQNIEIPYYMIEPTFSVSNKVKADLGETAFCEALSDFPVMVNVTYGKRQKDIDHLVFTYDKVVMNECKNTQEGLDCSLPLAYFAGVCSEAFVFHLSFTSDPWVQKLYLMTIEVLFWVV